MTRDFGAQRVHEMALGMEISRSALKLYGIEPIMGSIANPQTNGKLERFFQEYQRHRAVFHSIDDHPLI
jgi:putative transposase